MPAAKRPRRPPTSRQDEHDRHDEYAALFIERFGEAAWAERRAHDAEEAALYQGCKLQAFLDDPLTQQHGAQDLPG